MSVRRLLSYFFLAAGLLLCSAALLHYARGWWAQRTVEEAFERSGEPAQEPPADRALSRAPENPGIVRTSSVSPGVPEGYPLGDPLARLKIPSARMDYYVFAGSAPEILEKGPGHVPGTAMPGEEGTANNCVITAHRDSHFRRLGHLRKGRSIELETPVGTKRYRVVSREIVEPDAVRVLAPTDKPRLTLITCYPFTYIGPAPKRLVVVAEPRS